MGSFLSSPYVKILCCYLALFLAGLIPVPDEAWASFISHQSRETSTLDPETLEALRMVLENELITEKLAEFGLTEEEVIRRIEQLSPEERETVIRELDTIQSGGFVPEAFITILIILLILPYVLALCLVVAIFKALPEGEGKEPRKEVRFTDLSGTDFPAYEGKVKVRVNIKPEENAILVGSVHAKFKKKGHAERMLKNMKAEAAKHGADTIVPDRSRAKRVRSNLLLWSAQAYRTIGDSEETTEISPE